MPLTRGFLDYFYPPSSGLPCSSSIVLGGPQQCQRYCRSNISPQSFGDRVGRYGRVSSNLGDGYCFQLQRSTNSCFSGCSVNAVDHEHNPSLASSDRRNTGTRFRFDRFASRRPPATNITTRFKQHRFRERFQKHDDRLQQWIS